MIHSIHRCHWWCLWSSSIRETQWPRTTSCISLTYIHWHSPEIIPWYSWIITAHISLGNLNKQLYLFKCQKALAHELLMKLQCQPFISNFIFNALLGEFTNINSIYQSYKPSIWMAIQLLQTEPALDKLSTTDSPWHKRSLLPFLEYALQW